MSLRISYRSGGGRGVYEIAGMSPTGLGPNDLEDCELIFRLPSGIRLPTGLAKRQQGGKPRIRVLGNGIHIQRQLAALLLLPNPIRELNKTGSERPILVGGRFLIDSVDVLDPVIESGGSCLFSPGTIVIKNQTDEEQFTFIQRFAQVQSLWEKQSSLPGTVATILGQHESHVEAGSVMDENFEKLAEALKTAAADWAKSLGLEPKEGLDILPMLTLASTIEQIKRQGVALEERTLLRYHHSQKAGKFVILSGISGTGKTLLAEAYAEAVGAKSHLEPVAPNWTSNEDLLGYFNPVAGVYVHTPASLFLKEAAKEYEAAQVVGREPQAYHLILDEMNLARVEHYFAKMLSLLEVRTRHGSALLDLGGGESVTLYQNLYIVGTVNVDETTHEFADKVFDRAQLIEVGVNADLLFAEVASAAYGPVLREVWEAVRGPAPFAFRVVNEIRRYIEEAGTDGVPWQRALDEQLLQKVLPKLRGDAVLTEAPLKAFIEIAARSNFTLSKAKAEEMLARAEHGASSYF